MAFQKKCVQRMNEFRQQRKTMVFCSHSMFHVQELCDMALWIDQGKIRELGDSEQVVGHYEHYCNSKKVYHNIQEDIPDKAFNDEEDSEKAEAAAEQADAGDHSQDCRILSLAVKSLDGKELDSLTPLSDIRLEMEVEVLRDNVQGHFGFAFMKSAEEPVASFLTTQRPEVEKGPFNKGDKVTVQLVIKKLAMRVGDFYIIGGLADASGLLWYETKYSKLMHVAPNKGVGPLIMESDWSIDYD
jgi:ABC-type glutathione transport system ATPase component